MAETNTFRIFFFFFALTWKIINFKNSTEKSNISIASHSLIRMNTSSNKTFVVLIIDRGNSPYSMLFILTVVQHKALLKLSLMPNIFQTVFNHVLYAGGTITSKMQRWPVNQPHVRIIPMIFATFVVNTIRQQ